MLNKKSASGQQMLECCQVRGIYKSVSTKAKKVPSTLVVYSYVIVIGMGSHGSRKLLASLSSTSVDMGPENGSLEAQ